MGGDHTLSLSQIRLIVKRYKALVADKTLVAEFQHVQAHKAPVLQHSSGGRPQFCHCASEGWATHLCRE